MLLFFFFNDTATTEIYTLSLRDALPISGGGGPAAGVLLRTHRPLRDRDRGQEGGGQRPAAPGPLLPPARRGDPRGRRATPARRLSDHARSPGHDDDAGGRARPPAEVRGGRGGARARVRGGARADAPSGWTEPRRDRAGRGARR